MDLSPISKLGEKKSLFIDAVYYLAISLLLAAVFCYVIFLVKNNMQKAEIDQQSALLEQVGTKQQKEYEKDVIAYQKKISDFTEIFANHEFASRAFAFMQDITLPNVWFGQFDLDRKTGKIQLMGQSDNMEDFSRQVAGFESSKYVKSVGALNSALADSATVRFNISLQMDPELFTYIPAAEESSSTLFVSQSSQSIIQTGESGNLITVFDILLTPEVIGMIDQKNHTIAVNVPEGTNVSNLIPLIITSLGATVSPGSSVAQDFSEPVVYTVTAQNGETQDYTVTVTAGVVTMNSERQETQTGSGLWTTLIMLGSGLFMILVALGAFLAFKKKTSKKQVNEN